MVPWPSSATREAKRAIYLITALGQAHSAVGQQPTFHCAPKSLGPKSHFLSDLDLSDLSSQELFNLHY